MELKAVVIDFIDVKHADLSGLLALQEVMNHAKKQDLRVFLVNVIPEVQALLEKSEVAGDDISIVSDELREIILAAQAVVGSASGVATESLDVESLGLVTDLLRESKANSLLELATWSATKDKATNGKGITAARPLTNATRGGDAYALVAENEHEE